MNNSDFFQDPQRLYFEFLYSEHIIQPRIFISKSNDEIIGVLPFKRISAKSYLKISVINLLPFNVLQYKFAGICFLIKGGSKAKHIKTIFNTILKEKHDFQQLVFDNLIVDDYPLLDMIKHNSFTINSSSKSPIIFKQLVLSPTHEEYLNSMKKKVRYNLKRNVSND